LVKRVVGGDGWSLSLSVGLAVEDEFVGGGLEPVDCRLGEEGVGHLAEPFDGLTVRRDDGGGGPMAFDDQFVDVGGVEGIESLQGEVVDDEQVDAQMYTRAVGLQQIRSPVVSVGPGRSVSLSAGLVPRPALPNRTCEFPRIRLSTSPCLLA
jgi:hypothetical protein